MTSYESYLLRGSITTD